MFEPLDQPWRIAVVEDHLLQLKRTEELLNSRADLVVVHSSETLPQFVSWLDSAERNSRPHLLLLDLMAERQPSVDPSTVRALVRGGLKVVVLSALASPALVRDVIRSGVGGILGKRDKEEDIVAAVYEVLKGGEWITSELASVIVSDPARPQLSVQEERALVLYSSGLTLESVAVSMGVKPVTAKQYIDRVKAKYTAAGRPVHTKLDLNRVATADGYVDPAADTTRTEP
ncbi:helix-turn-helix domain-containing protein [Subtercola endophyticus]|uniref:hypothetical protein n=1 Tax=Subtercola endophyticus TaxID=2895559 RepID=UPI001E481AB3|nr:hypothetical protein [Subtercola endophyticus]UFS60830.1 hypothetical protein LQ955_08875 [Subtercola endophyticus]